VVVLGAAGGADEAAPLHAVVSLHAGQRVALAGPRKVDVGADPGGVGAAQLVGVVPAVAAADRAGARTAVAEVDRHRVVGMARQDPHREPFDAAAAGDVDHIDFGL